MVINKRGNGKARSMPTGLAMGAFLSLALTVGGAVLTSYLVLSEKIGEQAIGYCAIIILLLSSAAGALLTASLIKRRWMIVSLGAGGIYYGMLMAITAMFFGGQYQGVGVTALAVIGGCGAVGLLGLNRGNATPKRRKKHSFR